MAVLCLCVHLCGQPDLLAVGDLVEISEGPFMMKKGEVSKIKDGEDLLVCSPLLGVF